MAGDGGLWALIGFIGALIVLGMVANVVLLLDIKANIELTKKRRRRGELPDE